MLTDPLFDIALPCSEDTSEIFQLLNPESENQTNYNLRHERRDYPFVFTQKVIQNRVYETVNSVLKIEDSPWRKSNTYFKHVAFEKLKFMARQYVEPLAENRQNIVKQSLYFHELKSIKSREIQNIIISVFVESRRDFWHQQGVPKELENSKFKLE